MSHVCTKRLCRMSLLNTRCTLLAEIPNYFFSNRTSNQSTPSRPGERDRQLLFQHTVHVHNSLFRAFFQGLLNRIGEISSRNDLSSKTMRESHQRSVRNKKHVTRSCWFGRSADLGSMVVLWYKQAGPWTCDCMEISFYWRGALKRHPLFLLFKIILG